MKLLLSAFYFFRMVLVLCIVVFSSVQTVLAQETVPQEITVPQEAVPQETTVPQKFVIEKEYAPKNDLSNVPDEYIEEAFNFNKQCHSMPNLAHYQNCDCLAVKYLDKRIELGHEATKGDIRSEIEGTCPDATGAAGYYYGQCMSNGSLMPSNIPIEKFCECFANTYAKLYEELRSKASPSTSLHLQTQAMISCRDPSLAHKLYPQ